MNEPPLDLDAPSDLLPALRWGDGGAATAQRRFPVIKSRAEIEAEIAALHPIAKDFDTEKQSNDTCVAAGAHDALRWLLGLSEDSISETLKRT